MSFKIPYGSTLLTGPKGSILKCSRYGGQPQFFQDQPDNQGLHNVYPVYAVGGLLSVVFNQSGPLQVALSPYTECQVLLPSNLQISSDGPFYYRYGGSISGDSHVFPQWTDNSQSFWTSGSFFQGTSAAWWGGGASGNLGNTAYMLMPGHYNWKVYSAGPLNGFSNFVVSKANVYGPWGEFGAVCAPWVEQFNGGNLNDGMGQLQVGEDPRLPLTSNHVWPIVGGPVTFVPESFGGNGVNPTMLNMNGAMAGGVQSGTIYLDAWVPSIQAARLAAPDVSLASAIPNAGNCYQTIFSVPGSQNIPEFIANGVVNNQYGFPVGPTNPTEVYHVEFKLWLSGQPEPPFNLSINPALPGQYNILSGFPGGTPH